MFTANILFFLFYF